MRSNGRAFNDEGRKPELALLASRLFRPRLEAEPHLRGLHFHHAAKRRGGTEIDRVFVLEMKGKHLAGVKDAEDRLTDTGYKRNVFTTCTNLCKEQKWSELIPFMQDKTMRFEVVDEDGWRAKLKKLVED